MPCAPAEAARSTLTDSDLWHYLARVSRSVIASPSPNRSVLELASQHAQPELFGSQGLNHPDRIATSPIKAVNVACVPQYSPLRYPGGKTWLIPHIRHWLQGLPSTPRLLVEPFAGGASVSLTAVMEGLVERCLMVELDRHVAAFWHAALQHGPELCDKVTRFDACRANVQRLVDQVPNSLIEAGFRTLVLNRTKRGGILAPGASLARSGENGKGISSRWYPDTLNRRLTAIHNHRSRLAFMEGDGLALLESISWQKSDSVFFIDPPYTAGGKRAGKRLYAHNDLNHARLFEALDERDACFLMTYDRSPEIEQLIERHQFHAVQVLMKNTHHARIPELVITPQPLFEP